jgi:hypothetical protein
MEYKYIWIIIGDGAGLYLDWIWAWLATKRGLDCMCPAYVDWGPSVAADGSQITDTHTCLWEREDLLLSCHGFRLFSDQLLRVDCWEEV